MITLFTWILIGLTLLFFKCHKQLQLLFSAKHHAKQVFIFNTSKNIQIIFSKLPMKLILNCTAILSTVHGIYCHLFPCYPWWEVVMFANFLNILCGLFSDAIFWQYVIGRTQTLKDSSLCLYRNFKQVVMSIFKIKWINTSKHLVILCLFKVFLCRYTMEETNLIST